MYDVVPYRFSQFVESHNINTSNGIRFVTIFPVVHVDKKYLKICYDIFDLYE